MDDGLLTSRAAAGDLDAFGELYDRHVDAVYDFAWRTLRDGDEAAAALRETFARAANEAPTAGRRAAFKPWLMTIAHDVVLARAARLQTRDAGPAYEEAFGTFDVPDPTRIDPRAAVTDPELPALAWEAARELSPRDYALLDLSVRQGVAATDLAAALNTGPREAAQLVPRMHKAARTVLGGFIVARRCRNCEDLRHLLAPFEFPPYGDDVRQSVDAHLAGCSACQVELRAAGDPLAAFAALATIPVPLALKGAAWRDVALLWPDRERGAPLAGAAGRAAAEGDGGGRGGTTLLASNGGEDNNRILIFAVAVLGLLAFAFAIAAGVLIAGRGDDGGGPGAVATPSPETETPVSTRTAGVVVETSTPEPATETPVPTSTDTPSPDTPTPLPTDTPLPTAEPTGVAGTPTAAGDGTPAASPTP